MDIEQLKLILEMVGAAGDGAKDLALLWIALVFVKGMVGCTILAGTVYGAYRLSIIAINGNTLLGEVARMLGTSLPLSRSERAGVKQALQRGLDAQGRGSIG